MDKKRPLIQNEIEYNANRSDSELSGFLVRMVMIAVIMNLLRIQVIMKMKSSLNMKIITIISKQQHQI